MARAVEAAREWLADPLPPEPRSTALGIADLDPANVLRDGEVCRLVDLDAEAVGLDAGDCERMEAFRPLWAAFWLVMLLPGNGGWRRNPPGTTEAQAAHFLALVGDP